MGTWVHKHMYINAQTVVTFGGFRQKKWLEEAVEEFCNTQRFNFSNANICALLA